MMVFASLATHLLSIKHAKVWRRSAWGILMPIFLLNVLLLYPIQRTFDLPTWDESNYMGWGRSFVEGRIPLIGGVTSSPLYILAYGLLSRLASPVGCIYLMQYLLKIGVPLLLAWFLLWSLRKPAVVLVTSVLLTISTFNLAPMVLVYHAALAVFLVGLAVTLRSPLLGLLIGVCAMMTRQDYLLTLPIFAAYGVWAWCGRSKDFTVRPARLCCGLLLILLIGYTLSQCKPLCASSHRLWFAFEQHYALREVEAGREVIDPWIDYPVLMRRDFPGAHGLPEAIRMNAQAVSRHVVSNIHDAGGIFWHSFLPESHLVKTLLLVKWLLGIVLMVFVWMTIVNYRGARRRISVAVQQVAAPLLLASSGLAALAPGLLIYAKTSYLFPAIPLIALLFGVIVLVLQDIFAWGRVATVFCAVLLSISAVAEGAPLWRPPLTTAPVLNRIKAIQANWPPCRLRLLGLSATTYANYLGADRCEPIEPLDFDNVNTPRVNMSDLLRVHSPDAVIVNDRLLHAAGFDATSLESLDGKSWLRFEIGDEYLYLRRGVVAGHCP